MESPNLGSSCCLGNLSNPRDVQGLLGPSRMLASLLLHGMAQTCFKETFLTKRAQSRLFKRRYKVLDPVGARDANPSIWSCCKSAQPKQLSAAEEANGEGWQQEQFLEIHCGALALAGAVWPLPEQSIVPWGFCGLEGL